MEVGLRRRRPRRARWPTRSKGADAFFGLSAKGAVDARRWSLDGGQADHLRHGQSRSRDHAGGGRTPCARTPSSPPGRSDYPNQINNVLGFPFIFRGALDVQASHHQRGDEDRGRQGAGRARPRRRARPGRSRLPRPAADVRARLHHSGAVRSAPHHRMCRPPSPRRRWIRASRASRSSTWKATSRSSRAGSIRSPAGCSASSSRCAATPKRIVFAEGEEPPIVRAANAFHARASATPILIGRERPIARDVRHGRHRPAPT